ncbi:YesL family protein [Occultella kanbiaonis]|uniref:YesL family protein n=1 Tax=Occultella kanbiaonis TaxID=2675754 RepID=UPI0013CFE6CD|nr:DUF624 domain-containing protein [Occultella kanbiaonis]
MLRLLGWHTTVGHLGLRMLLLHLNWIGHTLAGGVVLGVFPATAAVFAIARGDIAKAADGGRLRSEFTRHWRREFVGANVLGYLFTAGWVLLWLDRRLLATFDVGAAGPALSVLLGALTVLWFVMTASVGVFAAHFAEGPLRVLRRTAVFLLARPIQAVINAVAVGVICCVYYLVPGLVPVFGVVAPAYLAFAYLWSTGILPPVPGSDAVAGRAEGTAAGGTAASASARVPASARSEREYEPA